MLWITSFTGLVIFYVLTSWLPILMQDIGITIAHAAMITALFPLGGFWGAVIIGFLMDRYNPHIILVVAYIITGIFIFAVGQFDTHLILLSTLIFLAGTTINGAIASTLSLTAAFYPPHGRATGVAYMLGIGRLGGIVGALLGVELLRFQLEFNVIFAILALPAVIAAASLLVKYFHPIDDSVQSLTA